jgi:hypothetical protein
MSLEQNFEVFDHLEILHNSLIEVYSDLQKNEVKERTRMLLDYLQKHEESFERSLAYYKELSSKNVQNSLHLQETCNQAIHAIRQLKITGDWNDEEILIKALEVEDCFIAFYKQLSDKAGDKSDREIFVNMAERISMGKKILVRDVGLLRDL